MVDGVLGICVGTGGHSGISLLKKVTSAIWIQSEFSSRRNCIVMTFWDICKPITHTLTRESQEVLEVIAALTNISPSDIVSASMMLMNQEDILYCGQLNITT